MTHRFTELRVQQTPVGEFKTCFAAIATPTLPETLAWAADAKFRRIVVQPHLLFTGEVLDQIKTGVAEVSPRGPIKSGSSRRTSAPRRSWRKPSSKWPAARR